MFDLDCSTWLPEVCWPVLSLPAQLLQHSQHLPVESVAPRTLFILFLPVLAGSKLSCTAVARAEHANDWHIPPLQGSAGERLASFFIGGAPRLKVEEVVFTPGDRFRLQTTSGGVIHLQLGALAVHTVACSVLCL